MVDDIEQLEQFDNFAEARRALRKIAAGAAEWAGLPMPIDGTRIVIEPSFPAAALYADKEEQDEETRTLRNTFWSRRFRCEIAIYEEDGKIRFGFIPGANHIGQDLKTLGGAVAWGVEQEARAVQTLAGLLGHFAFKNYMLTGMFIESSPRSHVAYLFRRLKPTVALSLQGDEVRVLCALCLHPIGYYEDSWAGAMCPTDDVIAHLMLMRGDEPMFWRRANQHPAFRPEAGL